jgi:rod shape-determining protein MreB
MGDFFGAEKCFSLVIGKLAPKRFLLQGPTVYIQLLDKLEGGVTNVEARAFREAAVGCGARAIFVPKTLKALSNEQLRQRQFKNWDDV